MDDNSERFLQFVKGGCKDSKINLVLSPERQVETEGIKCNGYFDHTDKILTVATGQSFDAWFKILVHEFSHMRQWIEQCKAWTESEKDGDANDTMDKWLNSTVNLSKKNKNKFVNRARDLELDCDKRALNWIRAFKLPINERDYIKRANAYIYFYTYIKETRKWYTIGKEPFNNWLLVLAMPTHFDNDYDNPPEVIKRLYRGCIGE